MRRREFIALMGGAAVVWPIAARAQQSGKLPRIGFLCPTTAAIWAPWTAAFVQRLTELGWIDGRTVAIEYGFADGHEERYGEIAKQFVDRNVDVILTGGSAVPAVKRSTSTIPTVFAIGRRTARGGLCGRAWRGRAATSPACRCNGPNLPASGLSCCAKCCPTCAHWQR